MMDSKKMIYKLPGMMAILLSIMGLCYLPFVRFSAHINPAKVQGANTCEICHSLEYDSWAKTVHFQSPSVQSDNLKLRGMASKMGIDDPEDILYEENRCVQCHFTPKMIRGEIHPIDGISCESCHGGARDWFKMHSYYGRDEDGGKATRKTETPKHRKDRMERGYDLGMIRPDTPYRLAENCYECHTVPDEELVDFGGHPAGSEFELVTWLMGEVRHNFAYTLENRDASRDYDATHRIRLLYVVGQMVELEYSLRGLAKSKIKGPYYRGMKERVERVIEKLVEIKTMVPVLAQTLHPMIEAANAVGLQPKNEHPLLETAEKIRALAQDFVIRYDGSKMTGIDAILPKAQEYRGKAFAGN